LTSQHVSARQIPNMPAESNCSEVYPKNMELRAFIPSPFSTSLNFSVIHF